MSSIMAYSLDLVYSKAEWEKIKIKITVHVGTEKPEDCEFWKLSLQWCEIWKRQIRKPQKDS